MAKLFLENSENFVVLNSNLAVFGNSGYEVVSVETLNLKVDQNVEELDFSSMLYKYNFLQAGNTLKVFDSSNQLVVSIPVREKGTTLNFAGETHTLTLSTTAMMKIDDITISSDNPIAIGVEPQIPIDTTPPVTPVVNLSSDTGASQTDKITNDARLFVYAEYNAKVEYSVDSINWHSANFYSYFKVKCIKDNKMGNNHKVKRIKGKHF